MVEDSILVIKILKSMEKHEPAAMLSLQSKNPRNLNHIEDLLLPTYGLPIGTKNHLKVWHTLQGRVENPMTPKNAYSIKTTSENHLAGIYCVKIQLEFYKEKYGEALGIEKMTQGALSNDSLYHLAQFLPQDSQKQVINQLKTLPASQKLIALEAHFQDSLEMSQEFVSVYGMEHTTSVAMAVNEVLDKEHTVNQTRLEQLENNIVQKLEKVLVTNNAQKDEQSIPQRSNPVPANQNQVPRNQGWTKKPKGESFIEIGNQQL